MKTNEKACPATAREGGEREKWRGETEK